MHLVITKLGQGIPCSSMKRSVHPTTPGGLNQSAAKKSRLADLHKSHAAKQAGNADVNTTTSRQHSQPPKVTQQDISASAQPPYNVLDPSVAAGPLRRAWQAPATSLLLAGASSPQQPSASGDSRALAQSRKAGSSKPGSNKAPPTTTTTGDALDSLTDQLLATNPALAGRPAEARATAGLRVRDRSVLLDNPPATPQTGQKAAGNSNRAGYTSQLRPLRARQGQGAARSVWLPRGCISCQQLELLQKAWCKYITDHIACVAQQQQQQQGAVKTDSSQAGSAVVTDAVIMRAMLSADLHGCKLGVVACCNPLLVGIEGTVVQVTRNAVLLMDKQNRQHVLPKSGCEVSLQLPDGRLVSLLLSSLQSQDATSRQSTVKPVKRRRRSQHPAKAAGRP